MKPLQPYGPMHWLALNEECKLKTGKENAYIELLL